jgi:sec-independent protein translocase protein TatC
MKNQNIVNIFLFKSNSIKQQFDLSAIFKIKQYSSIDIPVKFHFIELRQRIQYFFVFLVFFAVLAFIDVKIIVELLESPISNIKFFQLSPGEYFIETLKISLYVAIILIGPFFLSQLIFFISPGLTVNEKRFIFPLSILSLILFFISLLFSYFCLIPAALNFFVIYSSEVLEPLWSFSQYCDFILLLFFTTGIVFQFPIFQIIIGIFGFVSGTQMIKLWKYVTFISVIFGAILTPSTDPITQLLLSGAIIVLYFLGAGTLILIKG